MEAVRQDILLLATLVVLKFTIRFQMETQEGMSNIVVPTPVGRGGIPL